MRRISALVMALTLAALTACGGGDDEAGPPAVPESFLAKGYSRLSDPFGDVDISSQELPKEAVLIGRGYGVTLARSAVATELTEEAVRELRLSGGDLSEPPLRAGKGREFLLVQFGKMPKVPDPVATPRPKAAVLVSGERRELSGEPLQYQVIVASVPVGAEVTLEVTEDGQQQSINLRTGGLVGPSPGPASRSPRADDELAVGNTSVMESVRVASPGSDELLIVSVSVWVRLRAYDQAKGSPRLGHVWADVEVIFGTTLTERMDLSIDFSKSLTLRTQSGQVLRIPAGTTLTPRNMEGNSFGTVVANWDGLFEVPEKTRKMTVAWQTNGWAVPSNGDRVAVKRDRGDGSKAINIT